MKISFTNSCKWLVLSIFGIERIKSFGNLLSINDISIKEYNVLKILFDHMEYKLIINELTIEKKDVEIVDKNG